MISIKGEDFQASIVVFLIAVPLCLGLAVASNAPVSAGLISGIIGGLVVGSISKSHVSVSGPAAGLVTVVIAAISELGSFPAFLSALLMAGLLQYIVGTKKIGFLADYIPSSVIEGMLFSIGAIIIFKQIPFALGILSDNEISLSTTSIINNFQPGALVICSLSLCILMFWNAKINKVARMLPGPIVVVVLGISLNGIFKAFVPSWYLSGHTLVHVPIIDSFSSVKTFFTLPDFHVFLNYQTYVYGFLIASIASIETLLNFEAAAKIDPLKRDCDKNKELKAQGLGNMTAGLLGGIPITSVIVRSSANVHSGACSKYSAILHGIWILIAIIFIPTLLNSVPLASLAAVLIFTGLKLAAIGKLKLSYDKGLNFFSPFLVTIVSIVLTDLLVGILFGLITCIINIIQKIVWAHIEVNVQQGRDGVEEHTVKLPQVTCFLNKRALLNVLESIPEGDKVIFDTSRCVFVDFELKNSFETWCIEKNTQSFVTRFNFSHPLAKP